MYAMQAKTHNSGSPAVRPAEPTQKVASSARAPTCLPAWTSAWGDNPPAGLFLHEAGTVPLLQAKLAVSQPAGPYEQEAGHVAEQVMRMPEPQLQRGCACGGACPKCQAEQPNQEHQHLQTKRAQSSGMGQVARAPIVSDRIDARRKPAERVQANLLWHQPPAYIQAKLTIGQPGDIYEQEADRVADEVMRMPDPDVRETPVSAQAQSPQIQRTCVECEFQLQKQTVGTHIQRVCSECDEELHQIQRRSEAKEEKQSIQPRSSGHADVFLQSQIEEEATGSDFQKELDAEKAAGSPLPNSTGQFMESRFGVDFSQVRMHTGESASRLCRAVQAQAFTVGNHIYFGAGRYNPGSSHGNALIAHELAHTLQQAPHKVSSSRLSQKAPAPERIQRFYTFAPPTRPKGTAVHSEVLPMFIEKNKDSDLFIEVRIPGAKKGVKDIEVAGIADFYKAERTIGIRYEGGRFTFLKYSKTQEGKFQSARADYDHDRDAAPVGPEEKSDSCDVKKKSEICKLDLAPTKILLGDLKPGGTAETTLGVGQIQDYMGGLDLTTAAVNKFIDKNPDKVSPQPIKWNVTREEPIPHGGLKIPDKLTYPTGEGIVEVKGTNKLWVYHGNEKVTDSPFEGALYVYEDKDEGIWSYEWFPKLPYFPGIIPTSMGRGATNVNKVLKRLHEDVIPNLQKKQDPSFPKPHSTDGSRALASPSVKRTTTIGVQRQPVAGAGGTGFDLKEWEGKHYGPWKKDAEALLGGKDKSGEALVSAALVESSQRSGKDLRIPEEIKETGKGVSEINRWVRWGGWYGRLRGTFGGLFQKIRDLYERIKKWFEQHHEKKEKSHDFGSGPIAEAAKIAFGLMKQFLIITIRRVGENLATALKSGASALLEYIFSEAATKIFGENFEALKEKVEQIKGIADGLHEKFDKEVGEFLKDYEDEIRFAKEVEEGLKTLGDIFKIVKWGIRLFHCVTPPLLGCLKLVLEKVSEELIRAVVKSCWFQKQVILPLFNTVKFFRELPQYISDSILKLLRYIIPLQDPELSLLLPLKVKVPEGDIKEGELKCAPDRPTPEQEALQRMLDKYGEEKVEEMLKLLEAKGVNEGTKLTVADIGKIDKVLGQMSPEDLENAIKHPDIFKGSAVGKDLEEVVRDMTHKQEEKSFEETTLQLMDTASHTKDIAQLVKAAQKQKLYERVEWQLHWNPDKVKNGRVSAAYYEIHEGDDVAAIVQLEFIVLDLEKKWASGRIIPSSSLVNADGEIRGFVERTFFEGPMEVTGEGGSGIKK